jgi:hypothetical protein
MRTRIQIASKPLPQRFHIALTDVAIHTDTSIEHSKFHTFVFPVRCEVANRQPPGKLILCTYNVSKWTQKQF